ncbi:MAG: NADH-quinone oxidoreductase subunit NuoB [Candidatus Diapherotrites archaeon]|nr:NADH-quinone oxidoreductase subunit NuoB [Candidatus Diapherotrites archaeon]
MNWLKYSPWVYHIEAGSCNGCSIEAFACVTPRYDMERFGCKLVSSPKHADVVLITGALTKQMLPRVKRVLSQVPEPKKIVAVGTCAKSKGVFFDSPSLSKGVMSEIKVDVFVPGCPPNPDAILAGILEAVGRKGAENK